MSDGNTFDEWYKAFQGFVGNYVDWELLRKYLPENKKVKILDAAGGTGRVALSLAKMGYSVTLCDISPEMLSVAKEKMLREGVADKVEILECDVRNLQFADESFDFVICFAGTFEARKELIRVIKKGGRIAIYLVNKYCHAINNFYKDPVSALALLESSPAYVDDMDGKYMVVSPDEAKELFEVAGVRVLDIFAAWGWLDVLRIPKEIRKSHQWDEKFFKQTTEMLLKLSKEPSIKGMTRHLVLYGDKM